MDDCGYHIQDLSFSSIWDVPLIVKKDSIKQGRDHAVVDHLEIIGFLDIDIHQLQYLFLDRSETSNFGRLCRNVSCAESARRNIRKISRLTVFCHGIRDQRARRSVHIQHVTVDAPNL